MDLVSDVDVGALAVRLAIDVVAISLLVGLLSYRRHRRHDLVVLYGVFNIGLFAAVVVIANGDVTAAVGFGLFAVLSIIRLRSETLSNAEIAYFFAAIVIGLVTAVDLDALALTAALPAALLVAAALLDHPQVAPGTQAMRLTLDEVVTDPAALAREVERRLGVTATDIEIREVDYVRETTCVDVRIARRPAQGGGTIREASVAATR